MSLKKIIRIRGPITLQNGEKMSLGRTLAQEELLFMIVFLVPLKATDWDEMHRYIGGYIKERDGSFRHSIGIRSSYYQAMREWSEAYRPPFDPYMFLFLLPPFTIAELIDATEHISETLSHASKEIVGYFSCEDTELSASSHRALKRMEQQLRIKNKLEAELFDFILRNRHEWDDQAFEDFGY